jgi:hypothetical protein
MRDQQKVRGRGWFIVAAASGPELMTMQQAGWRACMLHVQAPSLGFWQAPGPTGDACARCMYT